MIAEFSSANGGGPCGSLTGLRILATGSYVPEQVVTNEHLRQRLGCDPAWVVKHTGMTERRHAAPTQATSDLCSEAGRRCMERAEIRPADVDLLVVGTNSPDMLFPATACMVQHRLGLHCPAMDVQAGCSGFMYALVTAAAYVQAGIARLPLVIGGDCTSRFADPADVKSYPLFGDGAGALLLTRGEPTQGLLSYCLGTDGAAGGLITRAAGGSRFPLTPELLSRRMHYLRMDGWAVFSWAVRKMSETIQDVLHHAGLETHDIDLYIPHQANLRIIHSATDALRIPRQSVVTNLEHYGNTGAGSIPLALDEAVQEGRVRPGRQLVLSAFGAGLAWGTAVLRW